MNIDKILEEFDKEYDNSGEWYLDKTLRAALKQFLSDKLNQTRREIEKELEVRYRVNIIDDILREKKIRQETIQKCIDSLPEDKDDFSDIGHYLNWGDYKGGFNKCLKQAKKQLNKIK